MNKLSNYVFVNHSAETNPTIDYRLMGLHTIHYYQTSNDSRVKHTVIEIPFCGIGYNRHKTLNALYQTFAYFDNGKLAERFVEVINYFDKTCNFFYNPVFQNLDGSVQLATETIFLEDTKAIPTMILRMIITEREG